MKTILVPFDFSDKATNAFRFAQEIASTSDGIVHLLHVIELPLVNDPITMPGALFDQNFFSDLREKTNAKFDELISQYPADCKVIKNIEFGPITKTIADFSTQHFADLIVMGSQGASGLKELFIGSNAEKVVRNSAIPVLVTKNYPQKAIKNIVFPSALELDDMQDFTLKVKALQAFFNATIHIVYVNTPANFKPDTVTHEKLNAFVRRFMFKDFTINIVNHEREEGGITQFTNEIQGDLIAMGTHGRKGLSHLIKGSVAENVVNHTQCPIWTYNLTLEPSA